MAVNTALTLHSATNSEKLYSERLWKQLFKINPALVSNDKWDQLILAECFDLTADDLVKRGLSKIGINSNRVFEFSNLPMIPMLELKCFFAHHFMDKRTMNRGWFLAKRNMLEWLNENWQSISTQFNAQSVSEIPHPGIPYPGTVDWCDNGHHNNKEFVEKYSRWANDGEIKYANVSYVKSGKVESRPYIAGRDNGIGTVHRWIIINKERITKPIQDRDIIYMNDIFGSEDGENRVRDIQRVSDKWISFYRYPAWLRPAIRGYLLAKVRDREFNYRSVSYFSIVNFRNFIYQHHHNPSPSIISNQLIEEEFLAWGNKHNLAGKNWWTNTARVLEFASRTFPETWPKLSINNKHSRRIKNRQAVEIGGRLHKSKEGAGRSAPKSIVDKIASHISCIPEPTPTIFCLGLATGARREDLHALLFDCLIEDPNDEKFMILRYWQNKVSKWNQKPLHKLDKSHAQVIEAIQRQRDRIVQDFGFETKYLFPAFIGGQENFVDPSSTANQIKRLCIDKDIRTPEGKIYNFSWHPIRHYRGTQMALSGYDALSIMFELGHQSPDMSVSYINYRQEIKKRALLSKGGGKFIDIYGAIDSSFSHALELRKDDIRNATRVCGGACTVPAQIGEWCEHANACFTCKYFRADSTNLEYFKLQRIEVSSLIEAQQTEYVEFSENKMTRLAEITKQRQVKNVGVLSSIDTIIESIEGGGVLRISGDSNLLKAKDI